MSPMLPLCESGIFSPCCAPEIVLRVDARSALRRTTHRAGIGSVTVVTRPRPVTWLRAHPRIADGGLAAFITIISLVAHFAKWSEVDEPVDPSAMGALLTLVATVPVYFRRSHPVAVLATVTVAQALCELLDVQGPGWSGVMIAVYSLGVYSAGPRRTQVAGAFAAVIGLFLLLGFIRDELPVGGLISSAILLTGVYLLGDNMQSRRRNLAHLAERAERAERERDLEGRQRTLDERARIARELHDVVAHSVSLMVIQAGAARRSIDSAPQRAQETLVDLEATGRQAMDELRRILGVMRSETDREELAPQPSLGDIERLAQSDPTMRVNFHLSGEPASAVPPTVGLSLYRVVQEALTNVRKHGGPSPRVDVHVTYGHDSVSVQIRDNGRGAATAPGSGQGLVGMRERMGLCAGEVTAGPQPGGGWQVRACAPLRAADESPFGAATNEISA